MKQTATGIPCPKCGAPMGVVRTTPRAGHVLRRRVCAAADCDGRLTTAERPVGKTPPLVTPPGISVGQLLQTLGLNTSDTLNPVNLQLGDTDATRRDANNRR
jgi:hypothetical protein